MATYTIISEKEAKDLKTLSWPNAPVVYCWRVQGIETFFKKVSTFPRKGATITNPERYGRY